MRETFTENKFHGHAVKRSHLLKKWTTVKTVLPNFFSNATFGSGVCQRYALNTLWLVFVLNLRERLGKIQA